MSDGSVNVESRTSSQDKRWTIMAALLGTNTALLLFQGIEQAKSPDNIREFALAVIAAALPFQAIYFLIYTFVLEHEQLLGLDPEIGPGLRAVPSGLVCILRWRCAAMVQHVFLGRSLVWNLLRFRHCFDSQRHGASGCGW